ncbi:metalloregulator ArsR/SmtB family transcription factor [Streptomyces sp. NPDC097619]|uniref:ArsR/SmtB family transcription factor n=1 Tax=Streptomyces sp. NPDC097619 TaxID=3157228 RepID=UPI003328B734
MLRGSLDGAADRGLPAPTPEEPFEWVAGLFGLLGSPVRLHLLRILGEGDADVSELAGAVGRAMPTISQHLTQLKRAGVVASRHEKRRQIYSLANEEIAAAVAEIIRRAQQVQREVTHARPPDAHVAR